MVNTYNTSPMLNKKKTKKGNLFYEITNQMAHRKKCMAQSREF
jgi:hypothetical protein